jgi:hypothetical protein
MAVGQLTHGVSQSVPAACKHGRQRHLAAHSLDRRRTTLPEVLHAGWLSPAKRLRNMGQALRLAKGIKMERRTRRAED